MYLRAREREILEKLLREDRFITTKEMARQFNVSSRTILRELKDMEAILKNYALGFDRKPRKGIRITGSKRQKQALLNDLLSKEYREFSQEERKLLIFRSLLETNEPLKLFTLADKLNVTTATLSNDLDQIEHSIGHFDLKLIRKRGYGVELAGSEYGKRAMFGNMILERIDEKRFLDTIENQLNQQNLDKKTKLFGILDEEKIKIVECVLEKFQQTILTSIADSAYIALAVHLWLAVERIQKGETIENEQDVYNELKETPEFASASMIVQELEKVFHIKIPETEIAYVTILLLGARRKADKDFPLFDVDVDISRKVRALINFVSKKTGYSLTEDHSLYHGLLAHLVPALNRMKEKMYTYNPLLSQIKTTFPSLFNIVKEGVKKVFVDQHFSEDAIGYLVLHFGSALEQKMKEIPLKALVVCSSGIGSSKMLASRLLKEFPEIKTIRNSSLIELKNLDISQYDIIISTVDLPYDHIPYIFVNPLLDQNDILKVKAYIDERLPAIVKSKDVNSNKENDDLINLINRFNKFGDTVKKVLHYFQVIKLKGSESHKQNIMEICHQLKEEKMIADENKIADKLLLREQKGGLGIPKSKIALFHLKDRNVSVPLFRIYELDKEDSVLGMDGETMLVKRILLLLAPEQLSHYGLEILSLISSSIIENEESLELFEQGNEKEVYNKLNSVFHHFMKEKF